VLLRPPATPVVPEFPESRSAGRARSPDGMGGGDASPRGAAKPVRGASGGAERDGADGSGAERSEDPPELDEPEELDAEPDEPESPRDRACAWARVGIANVKVMAEQTSRRVDLVIIRLRYAVAAATLLPRTNPRKCLGSTGMRQPLSPCLALLCGRHYDSKVSRVHATTVLAVRHKGKVVMASDGQVTLGQTVVKHGARKVRRLYHDKVLAGFAGAAADGFSLFSRFESKLEEHRGNLERAAVELARDWRTDRALRRLEAMLLVADTRIMYLLSGTGDLIEPDDGVIGIGSGGAFAMAAARALVQHSTLDARAVVEQAMNIAADICVYTNTRLTMEEL
jgi:ATP-dependent HslUV protease subunit HslV